MGQNREQFSHPVHPSQEEKDDVSLFYNSEFMPMNKNDLEILIVELEQSYTTGSKHHWCPILDLLKILHSYKLCLDGKEKE